ncbi:hypothetical protein JZ751_023264 [Albula glossodonta]|uniref:Uncharacterized protein n=1 Tax=Albula glossodonta TaxID=121402 RepID=A0A8T2PF93_9TELE|nr:hypothetical protein JZ751_023264 [Albula glossodonta]
MSSLWASKSRMMRSTLSANHSSTAAKSWHSRRLLLLQSQRTGRLLYNAQTPTPRKGQDRKILCDSRGVDDADALQYSIGHLSTDKPGDRAGDMGKLHLE